MSGLLSRLCLLAVSTRMVCPLTSGSSLERAMTLRIGPHVPIRILSGRLRPDDADRRALGVGAHDAERASGNADVDAARDHRLQRLAAAAGEQQLEVEVVLAENAGALAQRGRSPVPYFALPNRNLELVCGEGGDGCEPSRDGGGETNPDSMDHGGPHCARGICALGKLTPAAPAAKAAHPRPMEKPRSSR